MDILNNRVSNFRRINYNLNKVKQDKTGLHVPLLIGKACQSYIHDRDQLIDKFDSLKQYCYRYLQDDKFERTNDFINLLGQLLNGKPINIKHLYTPKFSTGHSVELINYNILLELLQKNLVHTNSKELNFRS